jgi:hypothetical protein
MKLFKIWFLCFSMNILFKKVNRSICHKIEIILAFFMNFVFSFLMRWLCNHFDHYDKFFAFRSFAVDDHKSSFIWGKIQIVRTLRKLCFAVEMYFYQRHVNVPSRKAVYIIFRYFFQHKKIFWTGLYAKLLLNVLNMIYSKLSLCNEKIIFIKEILD